MTKFANMWTYYNATCEVCEAVAHYRVGKRGFCRRHKSFADRARQAAAFEVDLQSAIARREAHDRRLLKEKSEQHHASRGLKRRGFK